MSILNTLSLFNCVNGNAGECKERTSFCIHRLMKTHNMTVLMTVVIQEEEKSGVTQSTKLINSIPSLKIDILRLYILSTIGYHTNVQIPHSILILTEII